MKPIQLGHNQFDYDIEFSTNNNLEIDEIIGIFHNDHAIKEGNLRQVWWDSKCNSIHINDPTSEKVTPRVGYLDDKISNISNLNFYYIYLFHSLVSS